jgi:uncharacterized protein YuzE
MKVEYYSDTDTLYIELRDAPSVNTVHCVDNLAIDMGEDGKPVGIEVEHASESSDLSAVETEGLAGGVAYILGQMAGPQVFPVSNDPGAGWPNSTEAASISSQGKVWAVAAESSRHEMKLELG